MSAEVIKAARDFFAWFNRHYPAPGSHPLHEWNLLGLALNSIETPPTCHTPVAPSIKRDDERMYDALSGLADLDTHDTNLRDHPKAYDILSQLVEDVLADAFARIAQPADAAPASAGVEEFPLPEIDYDAAIAACFSKTGYQQGTKGCIGFARGAEWYRDQMRSYSASLGHQAPSSGNGGKA